MFNLKQKYQNIKRAKKIITILAKYGLGYFLDLPAAERYLNLSKKFFGKNARKEEIQKLTLPQRTRLACEELGPTFVKLGQVLSTRPDLIHAELAQEFSKLQDDVAPFSFLKTKERFKKEFGSPISEMFAEFDEQPVAAASLSQVYKARLFSGEIVAVKVQRPNIKKIIEEDIAILLDLAKFAEKRFINGRIYQPVEIVKEFAKTVKKELDFINEGHNIDKFRANFKEIETVHIPKVYWNLTADKILTMEYIGGIKISNTVKLKKLQFDKKIIAARGADMILKQIFIDGFFHGDPHPGNIFVLKNNVIALLDFGMVGRISEDRMSCMADMVIATIKIDADKIVEALADMGIIEQETDLSKLKIEIKDFIGKYYGAPLKELEMGKIIEEILEMMIAHKIKVPSDLALLAKALITIESIGRELDPDFDMVSHTKPFAKRLLKKKYSIVNLWKRGGSAARELFNFLEIFPKEFSLLIRSLRKGDINVNFQHKGLEKLILEIDRASNRLSFSMIIGALIIGSSFVIQANIGPFVFGYPVLGIAGYLLASCLGMVLVISILRSGKWR